MVVDGLEATRHLLDRLLGEVQQHLDRDGDLRVLLGDDAEEFSTALSSSMSLSPYRANCCIRVLRRRAKSSTSLLGLKARFSHSWRSFCSVDLRALSLPWRAAVMASLAVRLVARRTASPSE